MTPQRAAELLPIIKAYSEGATIEYRLDSDDEWSAVDEPSFCNSMEYRINPNVKLRPWKTKEVPVGAVLRQKESPLSMLIVDVLKECVYFGRADWNTVASLLAEYEWRWPQETEWKPCGVVE